MELFIGYIVVQFLVQCALYYSFKWVATLIAFGIYFLTYFLTENKVKSIKISIRALSALFLTLNIAISCAVKYFTSSGAASGLSNLGASAILGLLMVYHIYKFKKKLEIYKFKKELENDSNSKH